MQGFDDKNRIYLIFFCLFQKFFVPLQRETITWSGSLTGEATITRQHSGQAEETVTYHYRIDTKITVKKK